MRLSKEMKERKERKVRRVKKRKRKGIEAQRVKHPTPSWATDALIGEWRAERKTKVQKERNRVRAGSQPSYPGTFSRLLRREGIIRWTYSSYPPPRPRNSDHKIISVKLNQYVITMSKKEVFANNQNSINVTGYWRTLIPYAKLFSTGLSIKSKRHKHVISIAVNVNGKKNIKKY